MARSRFFSAARRLSLEGIELPNVSATDNLEGIDENVEKKKMLESFKDDAVPKWKRRSFLALVNKHRETSNLFDALAGVNTYSSQECSEDILVKMKIPKHKIHPLLEPETKEPPILLDQLTDRYVRNDQYLGRYFNTISS